MGIIKEYLGFVMVLKVLIIVIVNKIDICLLVIVERILRVFDRFLKFFGCNKVLVVVRIEDDVIVVVINFIFN